MAVIDGILGFVFLLPILLNYRGRAHGAKVFFILCGNLYWIITGLSGAARFFRRSSLWRILCLLYLVLDNGPGVPAELRHKSFEPFFTTKAVGRGTGLGLSLSQGLMRSQHGKLELHPRAGGACFVVSLTNNHLPAV